MSFFLAIELVILLYVLLVKFEPVSFFGLAGTAIIGLILAVKVASLAKHNSQNCEHGNGY